MIRHTNIKDTIIIILCFWLAQMYQDRVNITHDREIAIEMLKQCDREYYIIKLRVAKYGR